jgi:L-asparaginase/Glu-tRNA(Gln) amidotransferase subunit D
LASIGLNIQLHPHNFLKAKQKQVFKPVFDSALIVIQIYPGLEPEIYRFILTTSVRAVLLLGYGVGNLPNLKPNWLNFIAALGSAGKLVFIGSQSVHGQVDMHLYEFGKQAEKLGCISLQDMTTEAALVKIMLLLGNFADTQSIRKYFSSPIAGEVGED